MLDDYQTKEGEILPFPPQHPRFSRFWSEEVSASSWIIGSEQLRGCLQYEEKPELVTPELERFDPGPGPNVTFECSDEVEKKCDDLFNAEWMRDCTEQVETAQMVEACKVEMCETTTQEQQDEVVAIILAQFVDQCAPSLDESVRVALVCSWTDNAGNAPTCGENQEYKECAKRCEVNHCGLVSVCTGEEETEAFCDCKEGFHMSNGECVLPKDCPTEGEWGPWLPFGQCSATCAGGTWSRTGLEKATVFRNALLTIRKTLCFAQEFRFFSELWSRTRICEGPAACDGEGTEVASCNEQACPTVEDCEPSIYKKY